MFPSFQQLFVCSLPLDVFRQSEQTNLCFLLDVQRLDVFLLEVCRLDVILRDVLRFLDVTRLEVILREVIRR